MYVGRVDNYSRDTSKRSILLHDNMSFMEPAFYSVGHSLPSMGLDGLDENCFADESSQRLAEDFVCPICLQLLDPEASVVAVDGDSGAPVCSHLYCDECLHRCWANEDRKCPICSIPASNRGTARIYAPDQWKTLCSIGVKCPHCEWRGTLVEYGLHSTTSCTGVSKKCKYCDQKIVGVEKLMFHECEICPLRRAECPYCEYSVPAGSLETHMNLCVSAPVGCPNECGATALTKQTLRAHLETCTSCKKECPYADVGCDWRGAEADIRTHCADDMAQHLECAINSLKKERELRILLEARLSHLEGLLGVAHEPTPTHVQPREVQIASPYVDCTPSIRQRGGSRIYTNTEAIEEQLGDLDLNHFSRTHTMDELSAVPLCMTILPAPVPLCDEIVVGCVDGSILSCRTDEKTMHKFKSKHENGVLGIVALKGYDELVTVGEDGMLKVWDKWARDVNWEFNVEGCINAVCYIESLNLVATGDANRRLSFLDVSKVKERSSKQHTVDDAHRDEVYCLCLLPNPQEHSSSETSCIASGGRDREVTIWSVRNDSRSGKIHVQAIASLRGHEDTVLCLSPFNSTTLVSGGRDRSLRIWDISQAVKTAHGDGDTDDTSPLVLRSKCSNIAHRSSIAALCCIPHASIVLSGSAGEDVVYAFDVHTCEPKASIPTVGSGVWSILYSDVGCIWVATQDRQIHSYAL